MEKCITTNLTLAQWREEKQIERRSAAFVRAMLKETKSSFNHPNAQEDLNESYSSKSRYSQGKLYDTPHKKGYLNGYEDFEEFLDTLNKQQLRLMFRIFINQLHQAAYRICDKDMHNYQLFIKSLNKIRGQKVK